MPDRDFEKQLRLEIRQRQRADASGELVRPPRTMAEQVMEEAINYSEIERLTARRQRIFKRLADTDLSSRDREDLSYELERLSEPLHGQNASQGGLLALAFAIRRRLAVSRSLMRSEALVT